MTELARFIGTPLALERMGVVDSGEWVVVRPFGFYSAELRRVFTVPEAFETDLASVPRLPLMYLLCGNTADEAAVIHDYLYTTGLVPRAQADAVFAEAIGVIQRDKQEAAKAAGVPSWRRALTGAADTARRGAMWLGVRLGGGSHYAPGRPAA